MSDLQDRFQFVDLANADHRRVRAIVRALEQEMRLSPEDRSDGPDLQARVVDLLGDLANELNRHFIQEREGGVLEEAVCRIPALATKVEPVIAAWPAMVTRIEALQGVVRDTVARGRISGPLAAMIHRALVDVVSLESSEDEILGSAFGVNLDASGPKEESA